MNIRLPGSKSITNRALLCASFAGGRSKLTNVLDSDDTKVMKKGLALLLDKGNKHPQIFCGNSGTTLRFLTAMAATFQKTTVLTGDKRMLERPIGDLASSLRQLGARVDFLNKKNFPPIRVTGPLRGGHANVRGDISSQYLSALLLSLPYAQSKTTIEIAGALLSKPYVDMTISVMKSFGVRVKRNGYKTFEVSGNSRYQPTSYEIEGDASSATYIWGLAALTGRDISISNIPKQSLQPDAKAAQLIRSIGIGLPLKPLGTINLSDMPDASLTIATLAAVASGTTIFTGLQSLAVKESDRLTAMSTELKKIGAKVKQRKDGWEIIGSPFLLSNKAIIKTYNDHRIAMCFGMLKSILPKLRIQNPSCVKKTYPNFWRDIKKITGGVTSPSAYNIVITGMRGSGKSKLGRMLAGKMRRNFYDIDKIIEGREGMTVADIVAHHGWSYFRSVERSVAAELGRNVTASVISTGGGTLIDPRNSRALRARGKVVLLIESIKKLSARIGKNTHRPALLGNNNPVQELEKVWKQRKKRYLQAADCVIKRTTLAADLSRLKTASQHLLLWDR
ncbi:MAG: 3-phosphoshikimate 1-carboxyvinyltransferase [Patescibacteria group bacterium]